jgi:hypothetical protein
MSPDTIWKISKALMNFGCLLLSNYPLKNSTWSTRAISFFPFIEFYILIPEIKNNPKDSGHYFGKNAKIIFYNDHLIL